MKHEPLTTDNAAAAAEVPPMQILAAGAGWTDDERQRLEMAAMMTTVVDDAKTILRTVLRENDDTVWIVQRKASRTGDKRLIAFFRVTAERTIAPITREVAIVMGKPYDQTNQGIWLWKGEDAIRLVVGPLSRILFDHSLALDAEWL